MKKICLLLTLFTSTASFSAGFPTLNTVDYVELDRYLGKWYEIARFEQKFQKGCTAVTAEYSMRKDGDIKVLNSCRLSSPDGKLKKSVGRAWVTNKKTNAKLKVQFFLSRFRIPFLSGNYWILDLDDDYQYAIVGDKSRKYLWILSRTKDMDVGLYTDLVNKAKDMHFNTDKLIKTAH
jgi:apolipoprotein D and lipocalin family protein